MAAAAIKKGLNLTAVKAFLDFVKGLSREYQDNDGTNRIFHLSTRIQDCVELLDNTQGVNADAPERHRNRARRALEQVGEAIHEIVSSTRSPYRVVELARKAAFKEGLLKDLQHLDNVVSGIMTDFTAHEIMLWRARLPNPVEGKRESDPNSAYVMGKACMREFNYGRALPALERAYALRDKLLPHRIPKVAGLLNHCREQLEIITRAQFGLDLDATFVECRSPSAGVETNSQQEPTQAMDNPSDVVDEQSKKVVVEAKPAQQERSIRSGSGSGSSGRHREWQCGKCEAKNPLPQAPFWARCGSCDLVCCPLCGKKLHEGKLCM
jgi:hypothetical protein